MPATAPIPTPPPPPQEFESIAALFADRLDAVRKLLFRTLAVITVGLCVTFHYSTLLVRFLEGPLLKALPPDHAKLYYTGVADKFTVYLKVSILASILMAFPYLLFELWNFLSPLFNTQSKKFLIPFLFLGTLNFVIGISFAFFLVMPLGFKYLAEFGGTQDLAIITLTDYFSLTLQILLVSGLIFEFPMLMVLVGKLGLVRASFLTKYRRHAILGISILAAIAAPSPDPVTYGIVLVPMWLLYEAGIIAVRLTQSKEQD
jgi:sec-independent protein translocase protein TatC